MCESFQKFQSAVAEVPNPTVPEIPSPNFQIPNKGSNPKFQNRGLNRVLLAFWTLQIGTLPGVWELGFLEQGDLGIAAPNGAGARLLPSRSLVFAE